MGWLAFEGANRLSANGSGVEPWAYTLDLAGGGDYAHGIHRPEGHVGWLGRGDILWVHAGLPAGIGHGHWTGLIGHRSLHVLGLPLGLDVVASRLIVESRHRSRRTN